MELSSQLGVCTGWVCAQLELDPIIFGGKEWNLSTESTRRFGQLGSQRVAIRCRSNSVDEGRANLTGFGQNLGRFV